MKINPWVHLSAIAILLWKMGPVGLIFYGIIATCTNLLDRD